MDNKEVEQQRTRQDRNAAARKISVATLEKWGIKFDSLHEGRHLIIKNKHIGKIDFWPGTGLWVVRSQRGIKHRGVGKLIDFIESLKGKNNE